MKRLILLAAIFLLSPPLFSQDYITKIAEKSCDCLSKMPDGIKDDDLKMQLGVCMIETAMPYKKQIKKDYDIDMDDIAKEGAKLGNLIGIKMASVCPDAVARLAKQIVDEKDKEPATQNITGVVTKVEKDFFVVFTVKDQTGKTTKYFWLTFVDAKLDLIGGYNSMVGRKVDITYENTEFFDPKIDEYRTFSVIKEIAPATE